MGDRSRIKGISGSIDLSGGSLTEDDIERAALAAMANFGTIDPQQIYVPAGMMTSWEVNPEYSGTPWASTSRLTKRERAVAGLHTTLEKLSVFKQLSDPDMDGIVMKTIKRLKKAKWARNLHKKVQSSP